MKNLLKIATLSAIVLLTAFPAAAQSYKIKYNFETDKSYLYDYTMTNKMTQEVMGNEMKFDSELNAIIRMQKQGDTESGNSILITSLDSATVKTSSPMGDTTMVMTDMLGKRIKLEISPLGKIVTREVLDSVEASLMNAQFNRETISLPEMSENEIKPGESWTVDKVDSVETAGGVFINTSKNVYTLVGKESYKNYECLKITSVSELTIEGNASMQGFDFVAEGTGKATGTIYFDNEKGLLKEMVQNMELQFNLAGTGQQNIIIPITQEMTNTYTLK
ncbi:MAG: hypothetical protein K8H86_05865 [Ignavibacteriaceae bacterium]|nr:hypothetical protein [Ignavibacteriaceae bacterium]